MLRFTSDEDGGAIPEDADFFRPNHYYRNVTIGFFEDASDDAPVGYGTVNSYCNYLTQSIAINSVYLGPASTYAFRENAPYFAGVILHELLHNLGWRHPSNDRERAVIYQAQSRIVGSGFNLSDPSLAKNCELE